MNALRAALTGFVLWMVGSQAGKGRYRQLPHYLLIDTALFTIFCVLFLLIKVFIEKNDWFCSDT